MWVPVDPPFKVMWLQPCNKCLGSTNTNARLVATQASTDLLLVKLTNLRLGLQEKVQGSTPGSVCHVLDSDLW